MEAFPPRYFASFLLLLRRPPRPALDLASLSFFLFASRRLCMDHLVLLSPEFVADVRHAARCAVTDDLRPLEPNIVGTLVLSTP